MEIINFFQPIKNILKKFIVQYLPVFYPVFLLIALIVGFFVALIIRVDYAIRGLIVIIPGILSACFLIWFFMKKKYNNTIDEQTYISLKTFNHENLNLFLLFILLYLTTIISLLVIVYRPWYYFVLIAAIFSLIFFQIIRNNPSLLIIFEIVFTSLNLAYGLILKYPLYFGATDILPHLYLSKITLLSGHIISVEQDYSYANYPLYHIFIAISTLFSGLPLNLTYFIVITIPFVILLFFLYKLFFILSKNVTVTLIACLLYATSSVTVLYSQYVVTRVFAYISFIIIFYLFYKILNSSSNIKKGIYGIILVESLFLILVHQVSPYQILFIFSIFFIIEYILENSKIINLNYLVLFAISFISYQIFVSVQFFNSFVLSSATAFIQDDLTSVRPIIQTMNEYTFLLTHIDLAIIAFFIFFGIGYALWVYRGKHLSNIGLFTLITLVFFLPNPLVMLNTIDAYLRFDRMQLLIMPFVAFIAAIGFFIILNIYLKNENINKIRFLLPLFLIIIFVFSFTSISVSNSSDSKDFKWYHIRDDYFNNEELQSFNFVYQFVPINSKILSDNAVNRNFFFMKKTQQSEELKLPYYNSRILNYENLTSNESGYSIIRIDEFLDNGLEFGSNMVGFLNKFPPTNTNSQYLDNYLSLKNVIFDSEGVKIVYEVQ